MLSSTVDLQAGGGRLRGIKDGDGVYIDLSHNGARDEYYELRSMPGISVHV